MKKNKQLEYNNNDNGYFSKMNENVSIVLCSHHQKYDRTMPSMVEI